MIDTRYTNMAIAWLAEVCPHENDPPAWRGYTPGAGEDSMPCRVCLGELLRIKEAVEQGAAGESLIALLRQVLDHVAHGGLTWMRTKEAIQELDTAMKPYYVSTKGVV